MSRETLHLQRFIAVISRIHVIESRFREV